MPVESGECWDYHSPKYVNQTPAKKCAFCDLNHSPPYMAGALGVLSSWAHGPGICRVLSKFWCLCTYIWEKYRKITCEQLMSGFHQWCLSSTCVHLEKNMLNFRGVNVVFLFFVGYNLKVLPAGKHSKDDIKGVGDFGSTIPKKLPPLKGKQFSFEGRVVVFLNHQFEMFQ